MAFANENDHLRSEVRRGLPGTVVFWPKVMGVGSVTASSATYTVHKPDGTQVGQGIGTISGNSITCAIGAQTEIDEDYQCRIEWVYDSITHFHVELFDVVLFPFGGISVGYDDLVDLRPSVAPLIARLAQRIIGDQTPASLERVSANFGRQAREELESMVRGVLPKKVSGYGLEGEMTVTFVRGWVVLDRDKLRRTETHLAMAYLFASEMTGDLEDDTDHLRKYYRSIALSSFEAAQPFKLALGDELSESGRTSGAGAWRPTRL